MRLHRPQPWIAQSEMGELRVDVIELLASLKAYKADPARFIKRL